jgi:LacI family transcriptional regulator
VTSSRLRLADVAKAAGVSKATVDRVINGRPGVRDETARLVNAALRELGYAQSALMARVAASPVRVDILIPLGDNNFFTELRQRVEQLFAALGDRVAVQWIDVPILEPHAILTAMAAARPAADCVLLVAADDPEVTDAIDRLAAQGQRVVTYAADAPRSRRSAYVGLDNFACGRLAGDLMGRFLGNRKGAVQILAGDFALRDQIDRISGFNQITLAQWPDRAVNVKFESRSDANEDHDFVRSLLSGSAEIAGLYISGMGNRAVLRALTLAGKGNLVVIGHEYTRLNRSALLAGNFDAVIALDIQEAAQRMVDAALGKRKGAERALDARIIMKENLPALD